MLRMKNSKTIEASLNFSKAHQKLSGSGSSVFLSKKLQTGKICLTSSNFGQISPAISEVRIEGFSYKTHCVLLQIIKMNASKTRET